MAAPGKSVVAGGGGSGARPGGVELAIPHTRIDDAKHMASIYKQGRKLGEGSFGVVTAVTHIDTSKVWACKAVNKERAGSTAIKLLEREVAILKRVDHEHIIKLKEVFETPKKMYLIMEYCSGGELKDVLRERSKFSETEAKTIVHQLASAITYLHRNDMVHRDLKLENILLGTNPHDMSDNLYIKVTDFGLSVVQGGVGHENMLQDFCGTRMYMSPEITENKTYSHLCDVWAMGVITYMLLSGSAPFQSSQEEKLYEIIKNVDIKERMDRHADWTDVTEEAKDCIAGMLKVDPAHRYSASEVLDHPWLTGKQLQSQQNPRNVLELMKMVRAEEMRNHVSEAAAAEEHENGGSTTDASSAPSSRDGSANSKAGSRSTAASTRPRPPVPKNRSPTERLHAPRTATTPPSGSSSKQRKKISR